MWDIAVRISSLVRLCFSVVSRRNCGNNNNNEADTSKSETDKQYRGPHKMPQPPGPMRHTRQSAGLVRIEGDLSRLEYVIQLFQAMYRWSVAALSIV